MKTRLTILLFASVFGHEAFTQTQPVITTFRVDGLIISKTRFDSLKLNRAEILKIRSLAPVAAASAYGGRASAGIGIVTTSKLVILNGQSAATQEEKESMLSGVEESQIANIRNLDAAALLTEFSLEHASGAIVINLRE